jgi:hypothetical protein
MRGGTLVRVSPEPRAALLGEGYEVVFFFFGVYKFRIFYRKRKA